MLPYLKHCEFNKAVTNFRTDAGRHAPSRDPYVGFTSMILGGNARLTYNRHPEGPTGMIDEATETASVVVVTEGDRVRQAIEAQGHRVARAM